MDVGLSDCQPPKRIPVQGVRSVEPPPASSTALALWCLPLVIGTNCVSIQTSLLLPSSRISLFFDRFYLKEYQKHVFHASCFCLASYAFSKTPVPPLDTPFRLPMPSISSPFPLPTFAVKLEAETCYVSTFLCCFIGFHLGPRVKFQRHSYHLVYFRLTKSFLIKLLA